MNTAGAASKVVAQRTGMPGFVKLVLVVSGVVGILVVAMFVLRLLGLTILFRISSNGMSPTLERGDRVVVERLTYLARKPKRGDVTVFRVPEVPSFPMERGSFYVQRIVGESGEALRIADGKLLVDGKPALLNCATGAIYFANAGNLQATNEVLRVPAGCFFMVGDNTGNSLDSRYWGPLPAANLKGRVAFRYWPPVRMGVVR